MKTKEFYLKLEQKLVVLSIFVTSLFLMSSCSILSIVSSPLTDDTYADHGYHFSAKDLYGQTFCYEILNDNEVALVIPDSYENKLPENVIVPKSIKYNGKNYTVSALYTLDDEFPYEKGTSIIRCKNLVIPETVKVIDCEYSDEVQNVIYYGDSSFPKIKYLSKGLCSECMRYRNSKSSSYNGLDQRKSLYYYHKRQWDARNKEEKIMSGKRLGQYDIYGKFYLYKPKFYLHVMPNCAASFTTDKNKYRVVNIADNYNIYEEGHSLEEYLKISKGSVDQVKNREKYKNGLWVPLPNGMVLCFEKKKNGNEVDLKDIVLEKGEVDSLIVPQTITDYDGNTYTVTSIDGLIQEINRKGYISQYSQTYVVLPETVKNFWIQRSGIPREIIIYSPDMKISVPRAIADDVVFHFPQGCANRIIMKKADGYFTFLEIVDNYDIYQEGNSLAEYIEKSRAAVKKAKEDHDVATQAALAAEKAAGEKRAAEWRAAEEAEAKRIRKELTSQYGAKYVNDLFNNGKLVIGMPIGLVRYGLKNHKFKKPYLYYMNLEHQSANSESYELRGSYDGFSGSIYLGLVYFSNGKVSSIRWANY